MFFKKLKHFFTKQFRILNCYIITSNKLQNAYILADFLCGNTFAYLGLGANTKQVQKSLSVAERISLIMNVKNAWQQVSL